MTQAAASDANANDDIHLDGVERVLVVVAHPDDCDFGAAGTIARWVQAGAVVSYCLCTDGDAGGFDATVSRPEMAKTRRREQAAAAAAVGVTDLTFLGYPDGRLTASLELRRDISRVIRQKRPHRVVCQSHEVNFERIHSSHPDHRAAGEATLAAVYPDARNQFAHPELLRDEGLGEWEVASTWIMAARQSTIAVDITESFAAKVAALRCHESQIVKIEDLEAMLRQWAGGTATRMGLAEGRLAEAFLAVDTR